MGNKLVLGLTVVLTLSLLANALLIIEVRNSRLEQSGDIRATGFLTKVDEVALLGQDIIEIGKNELIQCCSFENNQGEQDSCYVINGHGCSFCEEYCG